MNALESVAVAEIFPSKTNRRIDEAELRELRDSIATHGVLSPVLVRPKNGHYELVFGERRVRAAQAAGLVEVPAIVREMSDVEALEAQIIENCQRQDIHPLEEADSYRRLHDNHGYLVEDIAAKVGKSKAYVYGRMKLCELVKPAQAAFHTGLLTPSTALLIARMPSDLQEKATKDITTEGFGRRKPLETPMSFRQASEVLQRDYMLRLKEAPFPLGDDTLIPAAGSCTACPKRTGNQGELFGDVDSADVCTDPGCFRSKRDAQWSRIQQSAESMGYDKVLTDAQAKKVFPQHHTFPAYNSGYVDVTDQASGIAYDSKHHGKTYRQLFKQALRKNEIPLTVTRDRDGKIRTLIVTKHANAWLRKLGFVKPQAKAKSSSGAKPMTASEKSAQEAKKFAAECRNKSAERAVPLVAKALEKRAADIGVWRLLARCVFERFAYDARDTLARRQIPERAVDARLKKANQTFLRGFIFEVLLEAAVYDSFGDGYPKELVDAAKFAGVDLKKLEGEVAEELKPKVPAPPAASTKSGRKK